MQNFHKLENTGQSDLFLFVFLGLGQMYICIKYKTFMINHTGKRGVFSQRENGFHLKDKVIWPNI